MGAVGSDRSRPRLRNRLCRDDCRLAAARRARRDDRGAGREREAGAEVGGVTTVCPSATRSAKAIFATPKRARRGRAFRPRARQPAVFSARHRNRRRSPAEGCLPVRASRRHQRLCRRRRARISRRAGCSRASFPKSSARASKPPPRNAGLVIVRRRPVVFREGEPPLVTLFAMTRAIDLPPQCTTARGSSHRSIIRTADGDVHPEYAAVKLAIGFPPIGLADGPDLQVGPLRRLFRALRQRAGDGACHVFGRGLAAKIRRPHALVCRSRIRSRAESAS